MGQQYWPAQHMDHGSGFRLEARASFAWELIRHFGIVTGRVQGEDSANRAVLDVMTPEETVARAFAIADCFVDTAEGREALQPVTEADTNACYQRAGELDAIKQEAQYPSTARARDRAALKEIAAKETAEQATA